MSKRKVPLCSYCRVAPTGSTIYGRGKGRNAKKIARYICNAQKCWDRFYAEVDSL